MELHFSTAQTCIYDKIHSTVLVVYDANYFKTSLFLRLAISGKMLGDNIFF